MATENFCNICYEECSNMKQTKCNHSFCKSCFNKWMEEHDTCPMCRKQILSIKSDEQYLKEWYAHKNNEYSEIVGEFFENIEEELEDFEIDDDEDEYERRYLIAKRRILLKEFKVELLQLEKNFKKYMDIMDISDDIDLPIEFIYDYQILANYYDMIIKNNFDTICRNGMYLYSKEFTSKTRADYIGNFNLYV